MLVEIVLIKCCCFYSFFGATAKATGATNNRQRRIHLYLEDIVWQTGLVTRSGQLGQIRPNSIDFPHYSCLISIGKIFRKHS